MHRLRILVTDAQGLAGLGAVRSLGRAGHRVVAAFPEEGGRPPSSWSRYCDEHRGYPDAWDRQLEFQSWLAGQVRRGDLDAVLPIAEADLFAAAALRASGSAPSQCQLLLPSDRALEFSLSKYKITERALSIGVPCPRTLFLSDGTSEFTPTLELAGASFPVVIKTDNQLSAAGQYRKGQSYVAADAAEAARILKTLETRGARVIAQELIRGSGAGAFLLRFGGVSHLQFVHRRLHEVPYTGGQSSLRESVHDQELTRLAVALLDAIDYQGVAMVEFRRSMGGKPYLLEINGRLWGSLALALHCGVDFPKAMVECYQYGRPLTPASEYRDGTKCRNLHLELGYLASILQADGPNVPSKLAALKEFAALSFDPRIRYDHFWWSDPLPGIRHLIAMPMDTIRRARRALRSRYEERRMRALRADHDSRASAGDFLRPLNKIIFVCYGNICRSPFAERYWNRRIEELGLPGPRAESFGFHPEGNRSSPGEIVRIAAEQLVNLDSHRSRVLTRDDVQSADILLVMDRANYLELCSKFPFACDRAYFLGMFGPCGAANIADPYLMRDEDARAVYRQLVLALEGLLGRVHPEATGTGARAGGPSGPAPQARDDAVEDSAHQRNAACTPTGGLEKGSGT